MCLKWTPDFSARISGREYHSRMHTCLTILECIGVSTSIYIYIHIFFIDPQNLMFRSFSYCWTILRLAIFYLILFMYVCICIDHHLDYYVPLVDRF